MTRQIKAPPADRDLAGEKSKDLRTASESAWQRMQSGMDAAWTSVKKSLDKAVAQYK